MASKLFGLDDDKAEAAAGVVDTASNGVADAAQELENE